MANVVDVGGDAGSNLGQTDGTNVATFRLPGSPRYVVQSVVATVDNGAGGDTLAKVTVKDSSGQVIATNEQGETIPAGGSGTATFALRLVDSGGAIRFRRENRGGYLDIQTTALGPDGYGVFIEASDGLGVQVDNSTIYMTTGGGFFGVDTLGGTVQFNVQGGVIQFNNIGGDTSFENGSAGTFEADAGTVTLSRAVVVQDALNGKVIETTTDTKLGFYAHAPVAQQTGVAVTAAAIHAALVNLGLITA